MTTTAELSVLREILELAQQVTAVERADDEGHLDDVSILPDPNVGALTQIFREYAPPDTPIIVEKVASCPWCKSTTGVGSFKSYQLAKETYTRVCSSIAHRGHP